MSFLSGVLLDRYTQKEGTIYVISLPCALFLLEIFSEKENPSDHVGHYFLGFTEVPYLLF